MKEQDFLNLRIGINIPSVEFAGFLRAGHIYVRTSQVLTNCHLFNLFFFYELNVLSLCLDMFKNDVELNVVHINFNAHNYNMPIDSNEINWSSINPLGSVNVLDGREWDHVSKL